MDLRSAELKSLIARSFGKTEAEAFFNYQLKSLKPLADSARQLMREVPPFSGACVMISSSWVSFLREEYSIPAVVVAGDLKISGKPLFKYKEKLPIPANSNKVSAVKWDGHCWIEIDGLIGDLSIFRTAYSLASPNILTDFITSKFGLGRGALVSSKEQLPPGMQYVPRYVLNDNQVECFTASLAYYVDNLIT